MMNHLGVKNISTFLTVILIFAFLTSHFAEAASPQFLITWQAQSYAPSWYEGKLLPTKGSVINIALTLIDNGKIADLKKTIVRWYVNDNLVKNEDNGLGIATLQFTTGDYPGGETEMRISIPNYKGQSLNKIIRIPVVRPEVVISGGGINGAVNKEKISFEAVPFFFTVRQLSDLMFKWSAANQEGQGSDAPWMFEVRLGSEIPSGTVIEVGVTAQNGANAVEIGSGAKTIIVK